jgi:hypothetical protein
MSNAGQKHETKVGHVKNFIHGRGHPLIGTCDALQALRENPGTVCKCDEELLRLRRRMNQFKPLIILLPMSLSPKKRMLSASAGGDVKRGDDRGVTTKTKA